MDIVTQALELAKNITGFLGEFEAAGILSLVQGFLGDFDLSSITGLLSTILGILG